MVRFAGLSCTWACSTAWAVALVAAMLLSLGIGVVEGPLTSLLGSFEVEFHAAAFDARFVGGVARRWGHIGRCGSDHGGTATQGQPRPDLAGC